MEIKERKERKNGEGGALEHGRIMRLELDVMESTFLQKKMLGRGAGKALS